MQITMNTTAASTFMVDETEAKRLANMYVTTQIAQALFVSDRASYHKAHDTWLLMIRCARSPLHTLEVKAQTGQVIPLTQEQIYLVRQRAAIVAARGCHMLPRDEDGYVLAEYARQRATEYLDANLSMFYYAAEPLFVPGEAPTWQMTILFQMYDVGPLTIGAMRVNAYTGEPVAQPDAELTQIRERTSAIIRNQTPTTARG
jgi:hypothetical protein